MYGGEGMERYKIKTQIITEPEIYLPEGSLVASIKHHSELNIGNAPFDAPECWRVTWLEPNLGYEVKE